MKPDRPDGEPTSCWNKRDPDVAVEQRGTTAARELEGPAGGGGARECRQAAGAARPGSLMGSGARTARAHHWRVELPPWLEPWMGSGVEDYLRSGIRKEKSNVTSF